MGRNDLMLIPKNVVVLYVIDIGRTSDGERKPLLNLVTSFVV